MIYIFHSIKSKSAFLIALSFFINLSFVISAVTDLHAKPLIDEKRLHVLAKYKIKNEHLVLDTGINKDHYKKAWGFIKKIIPEDICQTYIKEFEVYHQSKTAASVNNSTVQTEWIIGVNEDSYFDDHGNLTNIDQGTFDILHELGHIVSLNPDQVEEDVEKKDCKTFHLKEDGCVKKKSYYYRMYQLFWKPLLQDNETMDEEDFYSKYQSQFVSEYSAKNIVEDFAETFANFVVRPDQPSMEDGKISNKKIAMLYEFPELVKLRDKIRVRLDNLHTMLENIDDY